MNKSFSKLSTTKRKIAVFFFCLIGGGLSIYYIWTAIIDSKKDYVAQIEKFEIPKNYNQRETEAKTDVFVDEETWNKVQYFKHYMDSLKKNNSPDYYIIMDARPGLMDSINQLEQFYYSQKLK